MTSDERALKQMIDRRSPSHLEFVAARDRVLHELRAAPAEGLTARISVTAPPTARWRTGLVLAAAAAVILAVATVPWSGSGVVRAGNAGRMLTLDDGSRVEMRAQAELSIERAADGIAIRLLAGDIIVNAATQRSGHLYVHTKEMTIAVVGTVFLVKAGEDGSRVAVIEGEVRVRERGTPLRRSGRQGDVETRLRPGEQVATSPTMARRPITEEILWSRNADAHLAILESFTKGMAQTAGTLAPVAAQSPAVASPPAGTEFEEASIRECDPDNLPPSPVGARGGGANSVMATPGRWFGLCVTPVALIRIAYGYRGIELEAMLPDGLPRRGGRAPLRGQFSVVGSIGAGDGGRVRGGPDWIRNERYTIEAVASGTPDAATMGGAMLRGLLERRFKLKTHVETEQTAAFNLVVAPGGLKIKPVASGACEMPVGKPGAPLLNGMPQGPARSFTDVRRGQKPTCGVSGGVNGPNWVSVAGEATLGQLTQLLRGRLVTGTGVTDKTGITDKFNWDLEYVVDGNAPNAPTGLLTGLSDAAGVPRAPTIFDALEQQLGLRLEPVQVPREYLVIDAIERPGPN